MTIKRYFKGKKKEIKEKKKERKETEKTGVCKCKLNLDMNSIKTKIYKC